MNEIQKRIGQLATLHTTLYNGSLCIEVRIKAVEKAYGRLLCTVTPICGSGECRVNEDTLSNFRTSPAQESPTVGRASKTTA